MHFMIFSLLVSGNISINIEQPSKFWSLNKTALNYPSGAEVAIYQDNVVNTIAADALAPCMARSSAAMVLIL